MGGDGDWRILGLGVLINMQVGIAFLHSSWAEILLPA